MSEPENAAPAAKQRRLRPWRLLLWLPLLLVLSGGGALAWLAGSDEGSAWLLRRAPGLLQVEAPAGRLLGDFSARQLQLRLPDGTALRIEGLRWQGLHLSRGHGDASWLQLGMERLQADRVSVGWVAGTGSSPPPQDLRLPLGLSVPQLSIGTLRLEPLDGLELHQIEGALSLGGHDGAGPLRHRLQLRSLQWQAQRLQGELSVRADAPMQVDASLQGSGALPDSSARWEAHAQAQGPLAALPLTLSLQASGQSLQARARLKPFADWPLSDLSLQLQSFDLAALHAGLPRTALSGELKAQADDKGSLVRLDAGLRNATPGPWNQGRLPLQQLDTLASLPLTHWEQLHIERLLAQLGPVRSQAGGTLQARGDLSALLGSAPAGNAPQPLLAELRGLRLDAIDARLSPLSLDGQLQLAPAAGKPEADVHWLALRGKLNTRWLGDRAPAQALAPQLSLDAQLSRQGLRLHELLLSAGTARAQLQGQLLLGQDHAWQAEFKASSQGLNPALLLRPELAQGQHSLNLALEGRFHHDGHGARLPLGEAQLHLLPSQLAGQQLQGELHLDSRQPGAVSLRAELHQERNTLQLQGLALDGPAPSLRLALQWPQLQSLQTLLRLVRPEARIDGSLEGDLALQALRPANAPASGPPVWQLKTHGQLSARQLQLSGLGLPQALSLQDGGLSWQLDTADDAALQGRVHLQQLQLGDGGKPVSLPEAQLVLDGSWARHRLLLQARAQAGTAPPGRLHLEMQGQLPSAAALTWQQGQALDWSLQLQTLRLAPDTAGKPAPEPWLQADATQARLHLVPGLGLQALQLAPGRVTLMNSVAWRWSQASFEAARSSEQSPALQVDAELESLALAPLLARWQPHFGWGGTLRLGGSLHLDTRSGFQLEAELRRRDGDLSVTEDRGVQGLELSDMFLRLQARDGVWSFTQALAGANLGALGGSVVLHTSREAWLPPKDAPLEGNLQLNVANLATWGGWVPAGWRLGGRLQAGLALGGTLGDPQLRGRAEGEALALRNPLMGVDVQDGRFQLELEGSEARLRSLQARAGDGELTLSGTAQLGAQPSAALQLQARRFALLSRVDRRLLASGQARLELGLHQLQLSGRFGVDEGLFDFSHGNAPTLDEDVHVRRAESNDEAGPDKPRTMNMLVQLDLDLGEQLRLRGRGLDTKLQGQLKLQHKDGKPSLTGTVRTEGGTYDAYAQKLDIEKGEVSFTGPLDNPRLDVLAIRPNTDTRVGVTVTGTAQSPRIKLFSEPELPDTDKLSWLLLGHAPDELGRADTALLQRAAMALLSGEGESTSGKLMKNIGLDELSVSQAAQDDPRGTVVRLGKQISKRVYVGYERGLNATTGSWQLIYRIAQRFTLRARGGDDNALDLIWQWKWK